MTATLRRAVSATVRRPQPVRRPAPWVIVSWGQRWQLVEGEWHREARVVRRADGFERTVLLPDTTAAAA